MGGETDTATLFAGALRLRAGAIPPLRAKILDTALVPSSGRLVDALHLLPLR